MAAAGVVLGGIGGLREAPFPALACVLYLVAVTRSLRDVSAALALAEASVVAAFAAGTAPAELSPFSSATVLPAMLFTILAQAAAWLIGRVVRQHRAYTRGLAAHSEQQAHAALDAARAAVTEQRLQIARDLHDVVAHSVSLMTVQAGAARMLSGTQPEEALQLLAAIEATGRDCLHETRRVLGILRADDGPGAASLSPVPGLSGLPGLVARSAAAGITVTVRTHGTAHELPATVSVTAYRIIQEALTNVIRHTTADRCQVVLSYGAHVLSVQVINPPAGSRTPGTWPPGTGHGLAGMHERATLHGGRLTAGPAPDGGFALTAEIPLPDACQ
jgi:signal transduction histidine kinase